MTDSQKPNAVRALDRINLRLSSSMFDAIDEARSARPGNVSRNTWIAEAIEEKLAREVEVSRQSTERKRHA
jgi:metal-responsive CopG/Arc/MetJ family transcriptional regulator